MAAKPNPFSGWCWPLRCLLDGRRPIVTSAFGPRERNPNGGHMGDDVMYRWALGDPTGGPVSSTRLDKVRGRWGYTCPKGTLVVAVGPGQVVRTGKNSRGLNAVLIDHGNTVISWSQHLQEARVAVGQTVEAGTPLGLAGWDTADAARSGREALHHLHFETWFKSTKHPAPTKWHLRRLPDGSRCVIIDPEPLLRQFAYLNAVGERLGPVLVPG